MAEKNEVEQLQARIAELEGTVAKLAAGAAGGGVTARPANPAHAKFRQSLERAKTVKIRVERFVKGPKPGDRVQVATPIVLSPSWQKLWPGEHPTTFEPGEEYEVPEPVAKALGPDVQII